MGVLGDPRFRWLLAGQTLASFGNNALFLALGIWAKDLTHSNALAGSVFIATGAPALLGPFTGDLVDRVRRRRPLLIANNLFVGAAVLVLLAVRDRGELWLLFAVAALTGLALTVVAAGRGALLKDLLPDERIGPANAVLQTLSQGQRVLSPVVGAGIYTWLGGHGLAVVEAVVFALAAAALAAVRVTESAPDRVPGARLGTEPLAGYRHIRAVPLLGQLAVVGAVAFSVVGLFETVLFAVIDQGLHHSPSFYGVVDTVQGAGAVAGGVVAGPLLRRLREARMVGVGVATVAAGTVGVALPAMGAVLAGVLVLGAGVPWFVVGWGTAMVRHTPARLQGRVNAAANLALSVPQTVSVALGAALIAVFDYRVLLAVIVAVMALCATILLVRPASAANRELVDGSPNVPVG